MVYNGEDYYDWMAALSDVDKRLRDLSDEDREAEIEAMGERWKHFYSMWAMVQGVHGELYECSPEHAGPPTPTMELIRRQMQEATVDLMVTLALLYADASNWREIRR